MAATHTPGTWDLIKSIDDSYSIEVDDELIASVLGKGNAKVMVAAPKLLNRLMATNEALRALIDSGKLPVEDEVIIKRNLEVIEIAIK